MTPICYFAQGPKIFVGPALATTQVWVWVKASNYNIRSLMTLVTQACCIALGALVLALLRLFSHPISLPLTLPPRK